MNRLSILMLALTGLMACSAETTLSPLMIVTEDGGGGGFIEGDAIAPTDSASTPSTDPTCAADYMFSTQMVAEKCSAITEGGICWHVCATIPDRTNSRSDQAWSMPMQRPSSINFEQYGDTRVLANQDAVSIPLGSGTWQGSGFINVSRGQANYSLIEVKFVYGNSDTSKSFVANLFQARGLEYNGAVKLFRVGPDGVQTETSYEMVARETIDVDSCNPNDDFAAGGFIHPMRAVTETDPSACYPCPTTDDNVIPVRDTGFYRCNCSNTDEVSYTGQVSAGGTCVD